MSADIDIEVVFALSDKQRLVTLKMPPESTVADAILASDIEHRFDAQRFDNYDVGIWGKVCPRTTRLKQGDRVEIYRELKIDPREMRRQLAVVGKTMRSKTGA